MHVLCTTYANTHIPVILLYKVYTIRTRQDTSLGSGYIARGCQWETKVTQLLGSRKSILFISTEFFLVVVQYYKTQLQRDAYLTKYLTNLLTQFEDLHDKYVIPCLCRHNYVFIPGIRIPLPLCCYPSSAGSAGLVSLCGGDLNSCQSYDQERQTRAKETDYCYYRILQNTLPLYCTVYSYSYYRISAHCLQL